MKYLPTLLIALLVLAIAGPAAAAPAFLPHFSVAPHYTSFDGKNFDFQVTNSDGSPIADGPHLFDFYLFDNPDATGSPVWSEPQTLTTTKGLCTAILGDVNPIELDSLGRDGGDTTRVLYLATRVEGELIRPLVRLTSVPMANLAERILGDITTSPGALAILNLGSSGQDGVRSSATTGTVQTEMLSLDLSGTSSTVSLGTSSSSGIAHLSVDNLGSSGQDGVRTSATTGTVQTEMVSLSIAGDSSVISLGTSTSTNAAELRVSNLGSSGQDGVRTTAGGGTIETEMVSLSIAGDSTVILTETSSKTGTARRRISNIGSSGQDGVTTTASPGTIETEILSMDLSGTSSTVSLGTSSSSGIAHLSVDNLGSSGQDGVRSSATTGTVQTEMVSLSIAGDSTVIQMGTSSTTDTAQLRVSNIGSSGQDGVTTTASPGTIETEILSMDLSGNRSSLSLGTSSSSGNSHLTLSNIGSSGEDGVSTRAGGGGIHTEMVSLDLSGTSSTVSLGTSSAVGEAQLTVLNLGSSGEDGVRTTASSGSIETEMVSLSLAGSSTSISMGTSSSSGRGHLTVANIGSSGEDGVSININDDGSWVTLTDSIGDTNILLHGGGGGAGGTIRLRSMSSGETFPTEILSMDLSSSGPIIASRPLGSASRSDPLFEFYYAPLDIPTLLLKDTTDDSLKISSAGLRIYDLTTEYVYDNMGIMIRTTSTLDTTFRASSLGDLTARGSCRLALEGISRLGVGTSTPNFKLHVGGNLCIDGTIVCPSDERLKTNIETMDNALETLLGLRGVNYDWKEDAAPAAYSEGRQIGFIAQEINEVLPEVVSQGDDGYYAVDYSRLTPLLVEAIKEQQRVISELKETISRQANTVTQTEQVQTRLSQLEELVQLLLNERKTNNDANNDLARLNSEEKR